MALNYTTNNYCYVACVYIVDNYCVIAGNNIMTTQHKVTTTQDPPPISLEDAVVISLPEVTFVEVYTVHTKLKFPFRIRSTLRNVIKCLQKTL